MIPPFNLSGLIPPFTGATPADGASRAPYRTDIVRVVDRFATSPDRIAILDGLLRYRSALAQVGLVDGFQWVAGSFVEDVEFAEGRSPNDVDIVSFFRRPVGAQRDPDWQAFQIAQQSALNTLFGQPDCKNTYRCDAYPVELDVDPTVLVAFTHYWFGLFSHRRASFEWKGLIEVPLFHPVMDSDARQLLTSRGGP